MKKTRPLNLTNRGKLSLLPNQKKRVENMNMRDNNATFLERHIGYI
jgi:hypothetical protein